MKTTNLQLDLLARIISEVAIPPFFTITLFCFFSYHFISSGKEAFFIASLSILFTTFIPALFVLFLFATGRINHHHVPMQNQRTGPYVVSVVSFAVGFWVLYHFSAPVFLQALILASCVNIVFMALLNIKWKISSHTLSAAAGIASFQLVFGWHVWFFYMIIFLIGWARIRVRAHTLVEVTSGALLGFGLTFIQMKIYLNCL